jgi:hypothetical protein
LYVCAIMPGKFRCFESERDEICKDSPFMMTKRKW